jgi:hypothetical protein
MDEDSKRRWDVRLSVVAPLLTVVGILVGVWQFNTGEDNRRQDAATAEEQRDTIAFKRRLWQEKLETYQKVTELAGKIVATSGAEQAAAYKDFQTAYWGAMVLVEDKPVEEAMIAFDKEYLDLKSGWTKDTNRLKVRADTLAKACRASLATGSLEVSPPPPRS